MPYLRFSRDERGYEHTYVLHGLRSGSRPRLLYWFRTPPNVNVGRLPLDEDAIRAIEDSNVDLTFDWAKMLRVKPKPAPVRSDDDGGRRGRGRGGRRERRPVPESAAADHATVASRAEAEEAAGAEARPNGGDGVPVGASQEHSVAALVGDDGLARLRAQYAELRARLTESRAEPAVIEEATARVEALNPDAWRPGEDAVLGIERFETEVAAVKAVLGRRRRRAPRGRRGTDSTGSVEVKAGPGETDSTGSAEANAGPGGADSTGSAEANAGPGETDSTGSAEANAGPGETAHD